MMFGNLKTKLLNQRKQFSFRLIFFSLFIIHTILLLNLSWSTSSNRTEIGHIGAAVYFWNTGRFDIFCVNPPLTRFLCGIPIVLAQPNYDWTGYSPRPQDRAEWEIGCGFIRVNDEDHIRLSFFLGRLMLIPLILLGGWFGYRFASELYGRGSGIVFLIFWTFSPLFLGWGAAICPDMPAAAAGVIGLYYFWHWLKRPEWGQAIVAGILLGLMSLTKMTWIIAFPLYVFLWGMWRVSSIMKTEIRRVPFKQLVLLLLIGLYIINMGYAFDGSFRPLGKFAFSSQTLTGHKTVSGVTITGNRFTESWLGKIPVPLPADFVLGIDTQKLDFERGMRSYLDGETKDGGWKSYYLYVLLYKEPIGSMVLFGIAVGMTFWTLISRRIINRNELIPLITAIVLFTFVSLQDGISIHPRYILPALPPVYIFTAKTGRLFSRRIFAFFIAICLAAFTAGSMMQYPHSMSFFNIIAGGVKNGPNHLLGSCTDWGQSSYFLRNWCRKHPDTVLETSVWTEDQIKRFGVQNAKPLDQNKFPDGTDRGLPSGWYALSVNDLYEMETAQPFKKLTPIKEFGASIWIYHIAEETAPSVEKTLQAK